MPKKDAQIYPIIQLDEKHKSQEFEWFAQAARVDIYQQDDQSVRSIGCGPIPRRKFLEEMN